MNTLVYQRSSVLGIDVEFLDQSGNVVPLTGVSSGFFRLRATVDGPNLINKTTGITFSGNVMTVPIVSGDTSSLTPGIYLAEAGFLAGSAKIISELFYVEIVRSILTE